MTKQPESSRIFSKFGNRRDLVALLVDHRLTQAEMIGRGPGTDHVNGRLAGGFIVTASERLAVDGHHLSRRDFVQRGDPTQQAPFELGRLDGGGAGLLFMENKLDDGAFYFTPAADGSGWELKLDQTAVTIDNAGNHQDFYYVIDNRQSIVAAKQKAEHVSRYGSICVFDRGDGQVLRKKLKTNTVYKVGVNIDTNLWDLFPSDEASGTQTVSINRQFFCITCWLVV